MNQMTTAAAGKSRAKQLVLCASLALKVAMAEVATAMAVVVVVEEVEATFEASPPQEPPPLLPPPHHHPPPLPLPPPPPLGSLPFRTHTQRRNFPFGTSSSNPSAPCPSWEVV